MPTLREFKLPDVGEGLTEGEILKWLVQPGDTVTDGQPIVEVETAKAAVELPCPFDGVVAKLHVDEGATVDVGTPIVSVDVDPDGAHVVVDVDPGGDPGGAATGVAAVDDAPAVAVDDMVPEIATPGADEAIEPGLIGGPAPGGRTSVLVGYGPKSTQAVRRARKPAPSRAEPAPPAPPASTAPPASAAPPSSAAPPAWAAPRQPADDTRRTLAEPPVCKLAKHLGVDLGVLAGS
ncbi:MAG: biotin/lipoyl-containing protein, partial [Mycobacteriales bacterium]